MNVASIAGHVPLPDEAPYCASKWGLRGFTFAVKEELREAGVAVCVVSPGPIATPFVLDDLDHVPDLVFSQPILTAEEVADAVVACAMIASASAPCPAPRWYWRGLPRRFRGCRSGCGLRSKPRGRR